MRRLSGSDWQREPGLWHGRFEGGDALGTEISVLFFSSDEAGAGPVLHTHPYDEVFIVRTGRARFEVDGEIAEAVAGDVLLAPANAPHRFENLGPGRLETTDIHLSGTVIQHDLE